ncbi:hypothetical protein D3C71_1739450 [compost metagenome]
MRRVHHSPFAEIPGNYEADARNITFPHNGIGGCVKIFVAVVERNHYGIFRNLSSLHEETELLKGDEVHPF